MSRDAALNVLKNNLRRFDVPDIQDAFRRFVSADAPVPAGVMP